MEGEKGVGGGGRFWEVVGGEGGGGEMGGEKGLESRLDIGGGRYVEYLNKKNVGFSHTRFRLLRLREMHDGYQVVGRYI